MAPSGTSLRVGSSSATPFRTISEAADIAQPGDTITVHEGTYRERIDPPRGGSSEPGQRIVYQAAPGETVVIKGSEVVKGWQQQEWLWTVTISNSFFGNYNPYSDLIHGDYMHPNDKNQHTGMVYLEGVPLLEAANRSELEQRTSEDPPQAWFAEVRQDETQLWACFGEKDPNAHQVEIHVRQSVFYPSREQINYITVRGFEMAHAASSWAPPTAEQVGLLGTHWSKGWIIENNTIRHSRCTGITLGKYGDEFDITYQNNSQAFTKCVDRALDYGWSKAAIGHHLVRNNTIAYCGQAGIAGSMGAVFSIISSNEIHDIARDQRFGGYETAGIKLHAPIDVVIQGNHIYRCGDLAGIWLDWMAQGTRVTGNLLHDNAKDLYMEVNHGPFLVDNNLLLSEHAVSDWSQGGAYAHNLIAGAIETRKEGRNTPYFRPHSMDALKLSKIEIKDERFYNNVFSGSTGLAGYNRFPENIQTAGNLYLNGASPMGSEASALVCRDFNPDLLLERNPDGWWLQMRVDPSWMTMVRRSTVTSELLGFALVPNAPFEQPDGSSYFLDTDYAGSARCAGNPSPGPFILHGRTLIRQKVWPVTDRQRWRD